MSRVTPWTTGRGGLDVPQPGGILDRRGLLVLGCSSQLLLLRLDVSDVGPVERVAVRARTTPPTGSLRADVPGSRTHPATPRRQLSVFGLFSLLFATIEYARRSSSPSCPGPSPNPTGADDSQRSRVTRACDHVKGQHRHGDYQACERSETGASRRPTAVDQIGDASPPAREASSSTRTLARTQPLARSHRDSGRADRSGGPWQVGRSRDSNVRELRPR
jgi:hypothetical protein